MAPGSPKMARSPGKIPTPKLKFTSKPTESLSGSRAVCASMYGDQMYGPDVGIAAKKHTEAAKPTGSRRTLLSKALSKAGKQGPDHNKRAEITGETELSERTNPEPNKHAC